MWAHGFQGWIGVRSGSGLGLGSAHLQQAIGWNGRELLRVVEALFEHIPNLLVQLIPFGSRTSCSCGRRHGGVVVAGSRVGRDWLVLGAGVGLGAGLGAGVGLGVDSHS